MTTIALPDSTKDELDELKDHPNESYADVVERLLTVYDDGHSDPLEGETLNTCTVDVDTEDLIDELKNELSMAADPAVQPNMESLFERIDTLESAVKEATQAAQSADRKLEDLQ